MSASVTPTSAVGASAEGKFVLEYLGTAMMDSRCTYTKEMMPWVIAEILRFSATTQVLLSIRDCRVTCLSLKGANVVFETHISNCLSYLPVTTVTTLESPFSPPSSFGNKTERKCFIIIFKANDIYQHCRLFSATSKAQVSEVFSTMKESSSRSLSGGGGSTSVTPPGVGGPLRSSSSAKVCEVSPISSESVSFEVLYVGKLRMSYKKAPVTFIDEALEKFRSHEYEKAISERRDSMSSTIYDSRRSSSQESSDQSSSETFTNKRPPEISISGSTSEPSHECFSSVPELSKSSENCYIISKDSSPIKEITSKSEDVVKSAIPHPLQGIAFVKERSRNPSGDAFLVKSMSFPVEPMRNRALSTGHAPREQVLESNRIGNSHYNRTMILIVGRSEMKIISPDAKTLLFAKHFKDIYQSSQELENKEYFGFICREAGDSSDSGPTGSRQQHLHQVQNGGFVAYVFRCQSEPVSTDILKVLKQATVVSHESLCKERAIQSCDHCPMVWYRQLCAEVDGLSSDERIQLVILKHINGLLEEDRTSILAKFQGAEPQSVQEQNELLMMLLRVHCEAKQVKHIHDTTENRHEFLNQFLGGSEIFTKAKRSITNSFDHFIKRKSRDGPIREFSLPHQHHPALQQIPSQETVEEDDEREWKPSESVSPRPRSSTVGALSAHKIKTDVKNRRTSITNSGDSTGDNSPTHQQSLGKTNPMMNLFQKMGTSSQKVYMTTPPQTTTAPNSMRPGSWRHAIFKKVVSPSTPASGARIHPHHRHHHHHGTPSSSRILFRPVKRTPAEIRELWKTAITQQIILIRMEKQNLRLREKQQVADVKRLKLSYPELGNCNIEANDTWDLIISQTAFHPNIKCDILLLNSALLRGIPKFKRGQVWQFFISQKKLSTESNPHLANLCHLNLDMNYEQLLRQLTSQQHAILIDLGRTFPTHPYFTSALGSGQLALFNILKAYSLLDTDVGYCQGLSFVAGLLLMHLEEEEAFSVLKYIMFDLGAREHYKPDMHELQVKLYQLTRLIHDQDADLLLLLNHYDVLPSLYAAPWFLTLFASQFSIGFAVRVLDVLLLHGVDAIAKFAVLIILDHKKELMQCTGLDDVMECFKTVVTNISSDKIDKYLKNVLESDWDKQMLTYSVEYSVMNDEAFHAFLNESSTTTNFSVPTGSAKKLIDKSIQTEQLINPTTSPHQSQKQSPVVTASSNSGGEKHPILGDLIQRQNTEISKLQVEKQDLRREVQTLLQCIHTMQQLAQISSNGLINLPVSPEVTEIASKYFMKCGTNYAGLLERGCKSGNTTNDRQKSPNPTTPSIIPKKIEDSSINTTVVPCASPKMPSLKSKIEGDSSDDSCDSPLSMNASRGSTESTEVGTSIRSKVDIMLTM